MADQLAFLPERVLTAAAMPGTGYRVRFYQSGTTTPVDVYTSVALDTPHVQPLVCDASGVFPQVFSSGGAIKAVVTKPDDSEFYTVDPAFRVPSSASGAASITFEATPEVPANNVQDAIELAAAAAVTGFAAFGLGITGNAVLLASIDATNIGAGVYRFDGTTTGTFPTGVVAATTGIVTLDRQTSAEAVMKLRAAGGSRVFARYLSATAWGSWFEDATLPATLGTAYQVPRLNSGATALEYGAGPRVLLATKTASASATLDFTEFNNAVFQTYQFVFENVKPATDNVNLALRLSTNGGSSYDAGASDYTWAAQGQSSAGTTNSGSAADTGIAVGVSAIGNAAGESGLTGTLDLYHAGTGTAYTRTVSTNSYDNTIGNAVIAFSAGRRTTAQDTDAIRFYMTTGNIASGTIRMYGLM